MPTWGGRRRDLLKTSSEPPAELTHASSWLGPFTGGRDRCRGRVQSATTRWRGRFRGREFPGTGSTSESPQGNVNHQGPQTTRDISFDHPTNAMSISCNCRLSSCVCDEYYGSARARVCVCARAVSSFQDTGPDEGGIYLGRLSWRAPEVVSCCFFRLLGLCWDSLGGTTGQS